jgi:hypothetical protein
MFKMLKFVCVLQSFFLNKSLVFYAVVWSIFGKVEGVTLFCIKKWAWMTDQFRPNVERLSGPIKVGLKDWGLNDWAWIADTLLKKWILVLILTFIFPFQKNWKKQQVACLCRRACKLALQVVLLCPWKNFERQIGTCYLMV